MNPIWTNLQYTHVVIHYHEIALKGDNRPLFVRRLEANLRRATGDVGVIGSSQPRGRILLTLAPGAAWPRIAERIATVFGVANFSPAIAVAPDPDVIEQAIVSILAGRTLDSFRISARRGDKGFALTSMQLNERLGHAVKELTGGRVDLERPATTIHVEVLQHAALIYFEKLSGPGGLPVGVSGTVAALISGGIDSPVAVFRMQKRGCRVVFVHFHSYPLLNRSSIEKVQELVAHLARHQFRARLHLVAFGEIQRQVVLAVPAPLRVVIYRRLMLRIADELARREGAGALVTGESLGQVASQTLENLAVIQQATTLPILRPLIGFDKEEITRAAQAIGTYEISIVPDQDCCRLFIPPHPAVRARLIDVERAERLVPIDDLVKAGINGVETTEFQFP